MATQKKAGESTSPGDAEISLGAQELYERAVAGFSEAVQLVHDGKFEQALEVFHRIEQEHPDEPQMLDRARSYASVCRQRLAPDRPTPQTGEEFYYQAVLSSNDGRYDEALSMFETALKAMPDSAKVLYARASTWALKGNAEASVGDLRRAIAVDPQVRFHAANDPDFEPIREEPAFIDIIEPTPSGG